MHLINEGITVSGRCAYVQFRGCGEIDHFRCKLDDRPITQCKHTSLIRDWSLSLGITCSPQRLLYSLQMWLSV